MDKFSSHTVFNHGVIQSLGLLKMLQLLHEDISIQISTTVYSQVCIHTAEGSPGAMYNKQTMVWNNSTGYEPRFSRLRDQSSSDCTTCPTMHHYVPQCTLVTKRLPPAYSMNMSYQTNKPPYQISHSLQTHLRLRIPLLLHSVKKWNICQPSMV